MRFWTLAFLLGHLAGAAPEEEAAAAAEKWTTAAEEKTLPPAAGDKMAAGGVKMAAGCNQTATSTLPLLTSLCAAAAAAAATEPAAMSTVPSTSHSAPTTRLLLTTRPPPPPTTSPTPVTIVLTASSQIALTGGTGAAAQPPVSVGSAGAQILIADAGGPLTPIPLEPGDEIVVAGEEEAAASRGGGGGTEILIGSSEENVTVAPIALGAGDQIVFATTNGERTVTQSSVVLGPGTEIQVAGPRTPGSSVVLSNGTEIVTDHNAEGDESDNPVVTAQNGTASTETAPTSVTQGNTTAVISIAKVNATIHDVILDVVSNSPNGTTLPPNPMTIVISLDGSSYSWAAWSDWYCNCANSSMSRIRGILDKRTGSAVHYRGYQPSHFQREPCNYKDCKCSRKAQHCHSANVTCSEPDPYTCVLSDINYQEIIDSKNYWKKLKKGARALYHKIKTFLKKNDEDT
uniref:uncharacterized protein n=1 Tax=Pristiophorus japonicus TaxID=55135 RepID=UPI00398EBB8B